MTNDEAAISTECWSETESDADTDTDWHRPTYTPVQRPSRPTPQLAAANSDESRGVATPTVHREILPVGAGNHRADEQGAEQMTALSGVRRVPDVGKYFRSIVLAEEKRVEHEATAEGAKARVGERQRLIVPDLWAQFRTVVLTELNKIDHPAHIKH